MDPSFTTIWFPIAAAGWAMALFIGLHDAILTRHDTSMTDAQSRTHAALLHDMLEWKHRAQQMETMLRQNNLLPVDPWYAPLPGTPAPSSRPIPHAQQVIAQIEAGREAGRRSQPSQPVRRPPSYNRWTEE